MWISREKYERLNAELRLAESNRHHRIMELKFKKLEINQQREQIEDLKATIAAREAYIQKLEAKDIKIVNEQSKDFIEVEHASIKAMNETLPKLRRQGWSDKLKVKIQGSKVYTVHEREVKEKK
ncbi:hypothetical protein EMILIAHAH_160 [Bacillus phage vB_BanH_Emiliahah]|nr:hypothetical protein EMILIAHAH_160 [Bacillus phage vB_BanH_Emiliahah]